MKIRILPYGPSESARTLGKALGVLVATPRDIRRNGTEADLIINWGNSHGGMTGEYTNTPEAVAAASDKVTAFRAFERAEVRTVPWTCSQTQAQEWLDRGRTICVRQLTRGHEGRGLSIIDSGTAPRAPLYTVYCKKDKEYRVHVAWGEIIEVAQKRRRRSVANVNWRIRSYRNGFVFASPDYPLPECVPAAARAAIAALGLDYGAVDIGYSSSIDRCRVYEVNTAPGIEGRTVEAYKWAFLNRYECLGWGSVWARRRAATERVRPMAPGQS